MNTQSPSDRIPGHAAPREGGVHHWWAQRLSSLAMAPLSIWFMFSAVGMIGVDHGAFAAWVGEPGNMLMLVLLIIAVFYHAGQGLQVVIEDYVHSEAAMRSALIASKTFVYVGGTSCLLSVLTIAFGR